MRYTTGAVQVFVVASPMLCWGFEKLVEAACPGIRLSGTSDTLGDALDMLRSTRVDVLVIDLDEGYDADAVAQAVRAAPVLLLTSSKREVDADQWLCLGVRSVMRKNEPPPVLLQAVEAAADNRRHGAGSPSLQGFSTGRGTAEDAAQDRIASLTPRERQLIFAVLCNATAPGKVIASRLSISEHTLRNHLSSIYGKLGVQNRLSLHAFAVKHRLDSQPGSLDA